MCRNGGGSTRRSNSGSLSQCPPLDSGASSGESEGSIHRQHGFYLLLHGSGREREGGRGNETAPSNSSSQHKVVNVLLVSEGKHAMETRRRISVMRVMSFHTRCTWKTMLGKVGMRRKMLHGGLRRIVVAHALLVHQMPYPGFCEKVARETDGRKITTHLSSKTSRAIAKCRKVMRGIT